MTQVWGLEHSDPTHQWLRAAAETLRNHLAYCALQGDDVRRKALESKPQSPVRDRRAQRLNDQIYAEANSANVISLNSPPLHPSAVAGPSGSTSSYHIPPLSLGHSPATSYQSSSPSVHYYPPQSEMGSSSAFSSPLGSPYPRSLQRSQSGRLSRAPSGFISPSLMPWTPSTHKRFETRIARLTASANFPLTWVDNPDWIDFVDDFIPQANPFSRKVLTRRLIPTLAAEFRAAAQAKSKGHEATVSADGWTGENGHHLIAFMITVEGKVSTSFSNVSS